MIFIPIDKHAVNNTFPKYRCFCKVGIGVQRVVVHADFCKSFYIVFCKSFWQRRFVSNTKRRISPGCTFHTLSCDDVLREQFGDRFKSTCIHRTVYNPKGSNFETYSLTKLQDWEYRRNGKISNWSVIIDQLFCKM